MVFCKHCKGSGFMGYLGPCPNCGGTGYDTPPWLEIVLLEAVCLIGFLFVVAVYVYAN